MDRVKEIQSILGEVGEVTVLDGSKTLITHKEARDAIKDTILKVSRTRLRFSPENGSSVSKIRQDLNDYLKPEKMLVKHAWDEIKNLGNLFEYNRLVAT